MPLRRNRLQCEFCPAFFHLHWFAHNCAGIYIYIYTFKLHTHVFCALKTYTHTAQIGVHQTQNTIFKRPRALHKAYGAALYFPTGHCVHNPPRTPENPALHMQSSGLSLASAASEFEGQLKHTSDEIPFDVFEYFPMEQSVQVKFPVEILYFPAGHSEQVLLLVSVYPALHRHAGLPAAETELLEQGKQEADPSPALYWLTPHCEHMAPFCPV